MLRLAGSCLFGSVNALGDLPGLFPSPHLAGLPSEFFQDITQAPDVMYSHKYFPGSALVVGLSSLL
jgi:hypothetical protein